jgi:hypothetical protein
MKIFLDSKDKKHMESRIGLIAHIYKKLTHRTVNVGFMWNAKYQQVAHK